jgi:hypothetical protein
LAFSCSRKAARVDLGDHLTRVAFEPLPIEVLGHDAELDDQVAGEVLQLDFTPFLAPQAQQVLLQALRRLASICLKEVIERQPR